MNKNLIALAVGAALVAPVVASADVTVYGLAQVEVAKFTDKTPSGNGFDGVSVVDNANGRVGVKASEDLGNGLTGLAKFEYKADTASGSAGGCSASTTTTVTGAAQSGTDPVTASSSTKCSASIGLTPRETMVGLATPFGTFELGRLKSAYKYAGGVTYDPFVATTLEARSNGGMTGGAFGQSGFLSNSLAYNGKFGPVRAWLTYSPDKADNTDKDYTAAVIYDGNFAGTGVEAFYARAHDDHASSDTATYTSDKIGGKVTFMKAHSVALQYELSKNKPNTGSENKPKTWFLGYQGKFSNTVGVVQVGQSDPDISGVDKTTYFALGAIYKFTKQTRIFGGYRSSKDKTNVFSVGMRKDF